MIKATRVPILQDNYAWLLRDEETGATAINDPAFQVRAARAGEHDHR